ncbi:putative mitochondrial hypothetical protein [Leptomonas pyrrhocoris]|uniref:Uncharacterized protein n=1 Tax=Leptomonas pyrrhocoris TaxID=157538 RepID=A0A0N0VCL1_LEPPY|nr:putative mitochondrial hypothetical protein [Leptomonas pyrrhocoris]KPA73194.1 putative mitochondrial hypothetical protein [Leptomonas pyrrhocoris]|eukprot:XP_015651633.1 putative mitochondrial hypothetical protein [Leptomonas pyrrhocoris]
MLRLTRHLAEHIQSSAQYTTPVFHSTKRSSFWAKRRRNFYQRGCIGRLFTVCGYGAAGVAAYLATCLVVRTLHQTTVDGLFTPGEDYTLEEWHTIEPTLRPGDIVLMRGSGLMSWTIATLQFVLSCMHPAALRYSHVAVVVAPAIVEYVDEDACHNGAAQPQPYKVERLEDLFAEEGTSAEPAASPSAAAASKGDLAVRAQLQAEEAALRRRRVLRRGAVILEAMDNKEFDVPDVTGKVIHDTVQLVEASHRLFSITPDGSPAYHYFAVRRLQNYEHTPARQAKLRQFCLDSEGRRMDGSLLYPLAFLFARLHTLTRPLRSAVSGEVSCSELVVELYQELGVVQRHWRWVPLGRSSTASSPQKNEDDDSDSVKENDVGEEEAMPSPTPADVIHDRSANSLHVYDYVYGRINDRDGKPVMSRDRPALPDASTIENGDVLAESELRTRSAVAPLRPVWPEVDAVKEFSDLFGRTLAGEADEAAREKMRTRATASYVRRHATPTPVLRSGAVAKGVDGRDYQLQWYYKHNSIATCPFHFTQGIGESVLDFAMNISLGPEIHMRIDRPGDAAGWILEGE